MNMIKLQRQTTDAITQLENELGVVKALLSELIPLLEEFKQSKLSIQPSQPVEEVKTTKTPSAKK